MKYRSHTVGGGNAPTSWLNICRVHEEDEEEQSFVYLRVCYRF